MQTGKHSGKIVVKVDENDIVTVVPRTPHIEIQSDATYVLAGGLGGICREVGRWLAEKGAKNLVFLSRSAAKGQENIAYIQGLKQTYGTNAIAFNCDVADRGSLQAVLNKCKSLPPIRGLVTGAMVLHVSHYDTILLSKIIYFD
jgi:NAD(P)-dependent dehydrogenase (short-subunit alcohol dehydrogenase family)